MPTPRIIRRDPSRRILYLTKDQKLIAQQLYEGLELSMADLTPHDLLDDINTDIMTPAWVCFHHDPHEIAKRAYAGLLHKNERVFVDGALKNGNFQAIVSGKRKGVGSSRETAAQCEKYSGINLIFADSFAPIHQRNNINLGQLMGGYELLRRFEAGADIPIEDFLAPFDDFSQKILLAGGLFGFLKGFSPDERKKTKAYEKPMTMAHKIIKQKMVDQDIHALTHHQSVIAKVDGGYSHEFTTAQVHQFLKAEYGDLYTLKHAHQFAAFEDHLIYADQVVAYRSFLPLIEELRRLQREFIEKHGIKDYSAQHGISPGICHEVARQDFIMPGDFIQATDSHTCMGGALNAVAFGVGATEYAGILGTGLSVVEMPKVMRFDLEGSLKANCSAKDIMLFILLNYTKPGKTLGTIMEFGGPGLHDLSIDERATLCNMATECGAKTGICEPDENLINWIIKNRPGISRKTLENALVYPDADCAYEGGRFSIDLSTLEPMVAHPGNPDMGIPSDPTNGELVRNLPDIPIDIAYGGSCTAGKFEDIDMYARVVRSALEKGLTIAPDVQFYIQYGSKKVEAYAHERGYSKQFQAAGVKLIPPGCGACIGCGPGVSTKSEHITVSAINRNFQGRSGPGKLYLASPYTVAASAFAGKIVSWQS